MRTVSDHIALLQDDVDPENATEEEALLLENGRSFRFVVPEKRSPAITAGGAMQLIIVYL